MKPEELRVGNIVQKNEQYYIADFLTIQMAHNYDPIPITENDLFRMGFSKHDQVKWNGNGYDYNPATSSTIQDDYQKENFVFRNECWFYRDKNNSVNLDRTSYCLLTDKWYPKICEDTIPVYNITYLHELQNIYYILTKKDLIIP